MKIDVTSSFIFKTVGLIILAGGFLISSGAAWHIFTELQKRVTVLEVINTERDIAEREAQDAKIERLRARMKNRNKVEAIGGLGGASLINSGGGNVLTLTPPKQGDYK